MFTRIAMPLRARSAWFSFVLAMLAAPISSGADLARSPAYRVLAQDNGHVAIVSPRGQIESERVEWEVECKHNSHDIARLENGNLLLHVAPAKVVEMTPAKQVVWQYEAKPKPPYAGRIEIHAFQRLPSRLPM